MIKINPSQRKRINELIKKLCCNCFEGNCLLLDDGEPYQRNQISVTYAKNYKKKGRKAMKNTFTDTKTNISYTLQGDYYLPNLEVSEQDNRPIGVWSERRKRYLKHHHKVRYYNLLTQGKLHSHLADVEEEDQELFNRLVAELSEKENFTEQLKADNPMLWVQKMNNIRNRAMEVVNNEFIFV